MPRYQLGSPNGWKGSYIETDNDDNAIEIAEGPLFREEVLDIQETTDEDGSPLLLLVVSDEEPS
jgi:hypothetical protein